MSLRVAAPPACGKWGLHFQKMDTKKEKREKATTDGEDEHG
jgi:hypothetical protein